MRSLTRLMRAEIAHSYIITYLLRFANKNRKRRCCHLATIWCITGAPQVVW